MRRAGFSPPWPFFFWCMMRDEADFSTAAVICEEGTHAAVVIPDELMQSESLHMGCELRYLKSIRKDRFLLLFSF